MIGPEDETEYQTETGFETEAGPHRLDRTGWARAWDCIPGFPAHDTDSLDGALQLNDVAQTASLPAIAHQSDTLEESLIKEIVRLEHVLEEQRAFARGNTSEVWAVLRSIAMTLRIP